MFSQAAKAAARKIGLFIVATLAAVYMVNTLRGPQGIPALIEKQRAIHELQEKNANLRQEIETKRERLKRLDESRSEQEQEIRKRLKLLRPGETSFILPEGGAGASQSSGGK
ncbi:MAG: septum formation initiator family protein [Bryobacterales bacterium]|nr:septum formation initiator family protein [Bryobacterales bacterium]